MAERCIVHAGGGDLLRSYCAVAAFDGVQIAVEYHEPGQTLVVVWLEMLQRRGVTVFGGKGISVDHRVQLRQLHALKII